MRLGQDVLSDLHRSLGSAWVLGNGLGGAAVGNALGAPIRPEQAHLISITEGGTPLAFLLGLEERLIFEGATHDLSTRLEPGGRIRPAGFRLLESFSLT